jgi:hypothetical protein
MRTKIASSSSASRHGGWTTLAFGALNYPGVKGLVNFAGGTRQAECEGWQGNLAQRRCRIRGRLRKRAFAVVLW